MLNEAQTSLHTLGVPYAMLFESMPGSFILLDNDPPRYTILAATPEYLIQTGTTKEGLIGKGMFEAFPTNPNDPTDTGTNNVRASFDHVILQKEPHYLPAQRYDVIGKDGKFSERYWKAVNKPVLSLDGGVVYIIHTAEDITAFMKAAEMEKQIKGLEESEQSLNSLVFQAPIGICVLDASNFVSLVANETFVDIIGKPVEKLVGRVYWDVFSKAASTHKDALDRVVTEGITFRDSEVELVLIRHGQREVVHLTFVYEPLKDSNGTVTKVVVWLVDNTKQVGDRKKVEESEAKLRNMVEQAPVAITLTRGMDIVIETINTPMLRLLNKKREEVVGKKIVEVLPEITDQAILQTVRNVLQTGKPFRGAEVPVDLAQDGVLRTHYFNLSYTPILEADKTRSVLHVAIDITEQVLLRKKIEESEGRFRLLADASPLLIWMLKPDGSYSYVNKTTLRFLGITQEQIKKVGWAPYQHPDDLMSTSDAVAKAVQNLQPLELEHRLLHNDGHYRWVYSQAMPAYDAQGSVFAYVGSSIDIDEAKKGRDQLQAALEQLRLSKEAAELGTFDMDLQKGTMHWDDRCRILFGISHQGPVTYERDFVEGLHPADRERIINIIAKLFIKSHSNGDYDVEYRTVGADDGTIRWVRAKGKVYFNESDTPVRFVGSVLDITEKAMALQKIEALVDERTTELAQAYDSLIQVNKELQRSNQNLEEFAHAASHDLKEPIRKIQYFTNQLKSQLSSHITESEKHSFSRIENASERMGDLIEDLLLYSHVSQRPHELESVDLNKKVQQALEDLDLNIEEKTAVIEVGKLPTIAGFRRQLQQLFQNLISNAIKYSKANLAPHINITATEVENNGVRYHVITVSDNGIGFPQEYEDKIFQMFSRLHGKHEYSGTGVGLSIVKKVVENHNGFIRVESRVGEGSAFKIYLPV